MILVGIPTHDGRVDIVGKSALEREMFTRSDLTWATKGTSLLTFNCNSLWCQALNLRKQGVRYFMMMHSDIRPKTRGFVGKMIEIMEKQGVDVLSAIVPIKDLTGLTSTAIRYKKDEQYFRRRLTLKEVHKLPETFKAHFVAELFSYLASETILLVNTGLILIDLNASWVEKVKFQINDVIVKDEKGEFVAMVEPEDWFFSRQVNENGGTIAATREIVVDHIGNHAFSNEHKYGRESDDGSELSG